jgi:predicted Rossmann fold nucleotide-binding protein DprA/Smf involved in DNA uptake
MTFAHNLPVWSFSNREGWKNKDKNNLIIKFFHEKKISIEDFFQLSENAWRNEYQLTDKQISDLMQVKSDLPQKAFLAETLLNNGIEVIPIVSADYSKTLKANLKKTAPSVIYVKGNKQIMAEKSIAIVGSREASDVALQFTDNIAKLASKEYKVVVSGFAKGVDKHALDATLTYKGKSIIVLPQGIMTFGLGFKTYYKQIINGDVLVLSIFPPEIGWDKGFAMARNSIIYGLAQEIYVAQSAEKGGTWEGVKEGLKKRRIVYVRKPDASEKNANAILIEKGAIPVDFNGNILENPVKDLPVTLSDLSNDSLSFELKLRAILSNGALSVHDIQRKLQLDCTSDKLTRELKKLDFIEVIKDKGKKIFTLKKAEQLSLSFD